MENRKLDKLLPTVKRGEENSAAVSLSLRIHQKFAKS